MTTGSPNWISGFQTLRLLAALKDKDADGIEEELLKLSERGERCSRFDVAQLYETGDLIPFSAHDAKFWYERGREIEGDPRCTFALAKIHFFGLLDAPVDMEQSFQLFRQASESGMHEASIVLVSNALDGNFPQQPGNELQRILKPAIEAGYVSALRLSGDAFDRDGRWLRAFGMRTLSWIMGLLLGRDRSDARLYMSRWASEN